MDAGVAAELIARRMYWPMRRGWRPAAFRRAGLSADSKETRGLTPSRSARPPVGRADARDLARRRRRDGILGEEFGRSRAAAA